MPFCTECGARHSDDAAVCPRCGSPIGRPPDDRDELLPAAGPAARPSAAPTAAGHGVDYVEQVQSVRSEISAQSGALQHLSDLSWANPEANAIRNQLTAALDRLHTLTPPPELASAHGDFVEGAELLANGFAALVDAAEHGDTDADRSLAESSIGDATTRFLRGAQAINDYMVSHGFDVDPDAATPGAEMPNVTLEELEGLAGQPSDDELDEQPPEAEDEDELTLDEVESVRADLMELTGGDEDNVEDEIPPLPPELETLERRAPGASPLPTFGATPVAPPRADDPPTTGARIAGYRVPETGSSEPGTRNPPGGAGRGGAAPPSQPPPRPTYQPAPQVPASYAPPEPRSSGEQWSATEDDPWPVLGDPAIDSLLLDIEGGWVRGRPQVHEAIERAVRAAVADALRGALETRLRIEQEARATLSRASGERSRLIDEVDALRREAHGLQAELAELRRNINDLERERQLSHDRRQQMFQDAEAHRNQLLKEIEQLGGQLEAMRRNIVSLLNISAGADLPPALEPAAEPRPAPPRSEGSPHPLPDTRPGAAPPVPGAAPSPVASTGAGATEVRITGVASPLKNMQLQRAIRALPGVEIVGQPAFKDGALRLSLAHDAAVDVRGAIEGLAGAGLSFQGAPAAGVLEFGSA